jgi:small subunit ribosomal protein S12
VALSFRIIMFSIRALLSVHCSLKNAMTSQLSHAISPFVPRPIASSFQLVSSPFHTSAPVEEKKGRNRHTKLHKSLYDGVDNGGLDYGSPVMVDHMKGPHKKNRPNKNPLGPNVPYAKGVVIRPVIKKPKKPNSANRKCVLIRLSNGKEITSYIPGEGHSLQEHNVVLVYPRNLKDVPGVKTRCVRGKYDLPHVVKKTQ